MNNRAKGNRNRLLAIKELEKQHYWVDVVEKTSKWAKQKDLWGLFDLIAIKREWHKIELKLIQVKSNENPPLTEFKNFKQRYGGEFKGYDELAQTAKTFTLNVEIWIKKDRKLEFEIIKV